MVRSRLAELRSLEGREVTMALASGNRIDGASLVSVARHGVDRVWIFVEGADEFVPLPEIIDFYEV